jgi:hypothetical protein
MHWAGISTVISISSGELRRGGLLIFIFVNAILTAQISMFGMSLSVFRWQRPATPQAASASPPVGVGEDALCKVFQLAGAFVAAGNTFLVALHRETECRARRIRHAQGAHADHTVLLEEN